MSRISYFQKFSQRENHATNNTMLLLRYFYEESPRKLQQVLEVLFGDTRLEIGLTFEQQVKLSKSVPDGVIRQAPFQIFIETKHGGSVWEDQIERHVESIAERFATDTTCLLIGLTREPSPELLNRRLMETAAKKKIFYRNLTFTNILMELRSICAPHDENLIRILDDYENFLSEEGLIDNRVTRLGVFLCGTSLQENLKHDLYYEPPSRSCRSSVSYIGAYAAKEIQAIGRIASIAVFSFDGNGISAIQPEVGAVTLEQEHRLISAIAETPYYDLGADDLRVYFVDKFVPTSIRKATPGPLRGFRYLNLSDLRTSVPMKEDITTQELAALVRGASF